jgi:small subunit ribosomal protein S16
MGRRNRPFYRVVVADSRARRDGRFIEQIGTYDPIKENDNFTIKEDRVFHWLKVGAQPSDTVKRMLSKVGIMLKWHLESSNLTEDQKKIELQKWAIAKANKDKAIVEKKEVVVEEAPVEEEKAVVEAAPVEEVKEVKAVVEEAKEAPAEAPVEEKKEAKV